MGAASQADTSRRAASGFRGCLGCEKIAPRAMPFDPPYPWVKLEQIDRNRFRLLNGFVYIDRHKKHWRIEPDSVGVTDLASVPWILWWFVASYGRQTRPALVHDQLVDQINRHYADRVFREALEEVGIGWVRRWLAWTAVSFETTFRTIWKSVDQTKTEAPENLIGQPVTTQRQQWWVTLVGFSIVIAHLLGSIAAIALTWDAWFLWRVLAWASFALWFIVWQRRGVILAPALILIVLPTLLLCIPVLVAWILELGPLKALRWLWWRVFRRDSGLPEPDVPSVGSTRITGVPRF
jgi:Protein of unknown function (DUF1353)